MSFMLIQKYMLPSFVILKKKFVGAPQTLKGWELLVLGMDACAVSCQSPFESVG